MPAVSRAEASAAATVTLYVPASTPLKFASKTVSSPTVRVATACPSCTSTSANTSAISSALSCSEKNRIG